MQTQVRWAIWSIFTLSPILLTFIVSIKKDKYDPRSPFFSKQTWNCYDIIWLLVLFLLIRCINWLLVWKGFIGSFHMNSYGIFLLSVLPAIFLCTIFRFRYRLGISTLGISFKNGMPNVILGMRISSVFGIVWFFGALLIGADQFLVDRSHWFYHVRVLEMGWDQLFVFFFTALVVAPIVEESVFRGFMYSPFSRKIGHKASVFVTSLVWAICHNSDMKSIASLVITGMVFAYFYVKSQSLIPSMIAHGVTNLMWFTPLLYSWLFQNEILRLNTDKFIMFMALFFLTGFIILSTISRRMLPRPQIGG